jgi:hypothetical protein
MALKESKKIEDFCKILQFFDTHFNPLDITLALKFVSSQPLLLSPQRRNVIPGPFLLFSCVIPAFILSPQRKLGSTRRRRGGYQMSSLPHQQGSGWLSPG